MRKAFTFMELIFVIVIAGILLAVAIPRLSTVDELQIATDQVISHIRYAQSLALTDDKYGKDKWKKKYWRVKFSSSANPVYVGVANGWTYSVASDMTNNTPEDPDTDTDFKIAKDPLTGRYLSGGVSGKIKTKDERFTQELALSYTYNIDNIKFFEGKKSSTNQAIAFDELGAPHTITGTNDAKKLSSEFKITLIHKSGDAMKICVEPETGYTHRCK